MESVTLSFRKVPFTKSLNSFVRKRLARWLGSGSPEVRVEMYREAHSPWVQCTMEVQNGARRFRVDQLARGPQQALEQCVQQCLRLATA